MHFSEFFLKRGVKGDSWISEKSELARRDIAFERFMRNVFPNCDIGFGGSNPKDAGDTTTAEKNLKKTKFMRAIFDPFPGNLSSEMSFEKSMMLDMTGGKASALAQMVSKNGCTMLTNSS